MSDDDDDDAAGAGAAPAGWQPEAPSEHWQVRGGCGMVGVGRTLAVLQTVWKVDRARACKPCCRAAPRECRPPLLLLASLQNGGALPASPRSGSGPARFSLDAPSMASDGSQGVILGTLQKAGGWLRRGGWRPVALCSAVLLALQSPGSFPGAGGSGLLSAAPTLALHCLQARRWWRCCQTGSWPPRRARAARWRPACSCRCAFEAAFQRWAGRLWGPVSCQFARHATHCLLRTAHSQRSAACPTFGAMCRSGASPRGGGWRPRSRKRWTSASLRRRRRLRRWGWGRRLATEQ